MAIAHREAAMERREGGKRRRPHHFRLSHQDGRKVGGEQENRIRTARSGAAGAADSSGEPTAGLPRAYMTGSQTVKVDPLPVWLSTLSSPPRARASLRLIASPIPAPSVPA